MIKNLKIDYKSKQSLMINLNESESDEDEHDELPYFGIQSNRVSR